MAIKINYDVVEASLAELKATVPNLPEDIGIIKTSVSKVNNGGMWLGDSASVVSSELSRTGNALDSFYEAANGAMKFLDGKYQDYLALEAKIKSATQDGTGSSSNGGQTTM